jgi:hypothetical protein
MSLRNGLGLLGVFSTTALLAHCAARGDLGVVDNGGTDAGADVPLISDPDGGLNTGAGTLRVTPATAAMEIDDGNIANKAVTFTAEQKQPDGTWVPVSNCVWSLGNVDMGAMAGATFTPSGAAGGSSDVTCKLGMDSASAKLEVTLKDTANPINLDPTTQSTLVGASTPDPSVNKLLYPYDKTVFPRGLQAAPEVMWNAPSSNNDVYAAVFSEPYATVTTYFAGPQPGRFDLPLAEWDKLGASNPDGNMKVTLYRLAGGKGGTAYAGPTINLRMSRASLKGTVYYWRIKDSNTGEVVRKPFGAQPQGYLQTPNGQCTGCHAVSQKGDVIAAGTDVYGWNSAYKKSDGSVLFNPANAQSGYRAVSGDGSVVAWVPALGSNNYVGEPVVFEDGKGNPISGAPNYGRTSTPAFSSDGTLFAFSVRNSTDLGQQHNYFIDSDLAIADYNNKTHTTSNPRTLLKAKNREAIVFPTIAPDDKRVAFQRGIQTRNRWVEGAQFSSAPNQASLWMINTDGSNLVELANASASLDSTDKLHSYHPIFSPVVQGGYFWMVFTSLRTYGNRVAATADYSYQHCAGSSFTDCRHQQIWVAAVDVNGQIATDPSHPAFWLPGQEDANQNLDAYWSLDACKSSGQSCTQGFECCEGSCRDNGNGQKVCGSPMGCSADGDSCTSAADCCGGAQCVGGVCAVIPVN